jgi:hypothetical protein
MRAPDFLHQVALVLRERGGQYGDAHANMAEIAARWSRVLGVPVTPQQVPLLMIELKLSRRDKGLSLDTVTDIAGYAALLAEMMTE